MAHRKKQHRRRRRAMSAPAPRRRRHVSKGFMGDLMNPAIAKNSVKVILISAGAGWGSTFVNKALPNSWGKLARLTTGAVGGFLLASMVNAEAGAGFMGGMTALNTQSMLGEDMEENPYAEGGVLSDMPLYLDEKGSPFVIEENEGEAYRRYLNDKEIDMLSEDVKEQLRISEA